MYLKDPTLFFTNTFTSIFIVLLFTIGRQFNLLICLQIHKWTMEHGIANAILFSYIETGSYRNQKKEEKKDVEDSSGQYDNCEEKAKRQCFI